MSKPSESDGTDHCVCGVTAMRPCWLAKRWGHRRDYRDQDHATCLDCGHDTRCYRGDQRVVNTDA